MQQLFQEPINGDLGAWMNWVGLVPGRDNGDFDGSEDQKNFAAWKKQATANQ